MITDFEVTEKNNVNDSEGLFKILSIAAFFVFTLGIALSSIYCMKCSAASDEINSRFKTIFDYISGDCRRFNIALNILTEHIVIFAVIIASSHFKRGYFFSFFTLLREGFINGFTLTSALSAFGIKGLLCMSTIIFEDIFTAAVLIMLTSVSAAFSVTREKKFKKLLIILSIAAISIFCGSAFSRGYITTTFIKILYTKIL